MLNLHRPTCIVRAQNGQTPEDERNLFIQHIKESALQLHNLTSSTTSTSTTSSTSLSTSTLAPLDGGFLTLDHIQCPSHLWGVFWDRWRPVEPLHRLMTWEWQWRTTDATLGWLLNLTHKAARERGSMALSDHCTSISPKLLIGQEVTRHGHHLDMHPVFSFSPVRAKDGC